MRFKLNFKNIFGYIGLILFFTFITFFFDANLGVVILSVFGIIILLSILSTAIGMHFIKIDMPVKKIQDKRGSKISVKIEISSRFPLPFTFIEIFLKEQVYLENLGESHFVCMVDAFNKYVHNIDYVTKVFGTDIIAIEKIIFRDFAGIFSYEKRIVNKEIVSLTLPRYTEMEYGSEILQISQYTSDFDDSEESNNQMKSATGFLGYEHREYQPGDSLKRINYKLSAKKGKLFVREYEPVSYIRQAIILDSISSENRYKRELLLEGMLSYAGYIIKNGVCAEVYITTEEGIRVITLANEASLDKLVDASGEVKFFDTSKDAPKISIKRADKISSIVMFSSRVKAFGNMEKSLPPVPVNFITTSSNINGSNIWHINATHEITKEA